MLLPLQGENAVVYSLHRAPLRSALGYEQVAPAGRVFKIQKKSRTIFDQINAVTH